MPGKMNILNLKKTDFLHSRNFQITETNERELGKVFDFLKFIISVRGSCCDAGSGH